MDSTQVCGSLLGAGLSLALVLGARNFRRARKAALETLLISELDLRPPKTELTESTTTRGGSAALLALPGLFLLNSANRAFIAGDTRRIEPPGAAKRTHVRRWIDGVWILCQIALAVGLFVGAASIVLRAFLLHATGETTEGVVTGAWTGFAGKTAVYHIEYRFMVGGQDEHTYSAEVKVDGSAYARLAKGSRVEVVYFPFDPDISDVASGSLSENDPSVAGLFAAVSGGAIVWVIRFRYRRYKLSKHGKLLQGVITSWKEQRRAGKRGTGVHYWNVVMKYCFRTLGGQTIWGSKEFNTRDASWLVGESGMPVAVIYVNKRLHDVL